MPSKLPIRAAVALLSAFAVPPVAAADDEAAPARFASLHAFDGREGGGPSAGLARGPDGTLWGTTWGGGQWGRGTLFRTIPGGRTEIVHDFFAGAHDGMRPLAGMTLAADGNFYGTASRGGTTGDGVLYRLTPAGGFTVVHSFCVDDSCAAMPASDLVAGPDGALYGTTVGGGPGGAGTVFRTTLDGATTILHGFAGDDGRWPAAAVVFGADGLLYGTTQAGGRADEGTLFRVAIDGSGFERLHAFSSAAGDGATPMAPLVLGRDGVFYGTTSAGGAHGLGTVFRLGPHGAVTVLHSFDADGHDGAQPKAGLVQGADGAFYGTTAAGGSDVEGCPYQPGCGTVFRIDAAGHVRIVHAFTTTAAGQTPIAGLLDGGDGRLYGTTYGAFYLQRYGSVFAVAARP